MTDDSGCLWPEAKISADFLASIIDHVAHPVFVKDRGFRFVLVNKAFMKLTGLTRDELLGHTDHDLFSSDEADFFQKKDAELFSTQSEVVIEEEPFTDSEGTRHTLATTKVPLRDDEGEVRHLVGIIHDISRRKEMENQLREANEMLERSVERRTRELQDMNQQLLQKERLAMLGRIAGGLAHQIRNPLGSISNAAFVLRRMLKHESNPDVASSVEIILEEAAHTNQIITQLLDNARVRPSLPQPIRARELLDQAVHQKTIPEHIDVVWQIPEELPDALVDVDQSRTALGHILNNAIEAMPDGGTLTLRGSEKEATLVIEIEDTGSGIPEEVRDRLFEPLVTTKPSGIGLGLTTSRNLIETQGGTISWQSLERGTRMGVELPKRMDAGREEAGRDEAGRVGGRSD